jgi:hypothetical protein
MRPRKLVRKRCITAKEACSNLPKGQRNELTWYRGHHAGIYDAYLTLKTKYPTAAKALLRVYDMDEEGIIK